MPQLDQVNTAPPSAEELDQINIIRDACQEDIDALRFPEDDIIGDFRICRFLRARHHDISAAKEWFRGFLRTRVENDHFLERLHAKLCGKTPEQFLQWFDAVTPPHVFVAPYAGRTREGHMVVFLRQGKIDFGKLVDLKHLPALRDAMLGMMEWTLWQLNVWSRQENRMAYVIKVMDFDGLGSEGRRLPIVYSEVRGMLGSMLSNFSTNYCDHDVAFCCINTPFMFRAVFAVINIFLTARQKQKMLMMGSTSSDSVKKALLELIPAELLPVAYGGTCKLVFRVHPLTGDEEIEVKLAQMRGALDEDAEIHMKPSGHTATTSSPSTDKESPPTAEVFYDGDRAVPSLPIPNKRTTASTDVLPPEDNQPRHAEGDLALTEAP